MQIDRLWTLLDLHRQELHKSSARHALSSNGKKELSIDQNFFLVEGSDKIRNINIDSRHDNVCRNFALDDLMLDVDRNFITMY